MLHCLADLFVTHGPPEHIRSDNGPEFVAINVRDWLGRIGVKTLYIEPGSPWENGYCESLNSKLRDELLNGEIFTTLREAQVLIEKWRRHYNAIRPHSSLGYRPPAPRGDLAASARSALRSASASPDAGRRRPGSNLVPGIVPRGRPGSSAGDLIDERTVATRSSTQARAVDRATHPRSRPLWVQAELLRSDLLI